MTNTLKALAILALTAAVAPGFAQTTASSPSTPKKVHRKPAVPKGPTVQQQIEELRQQQQADHGQIDTLKQQLSDRDAQLQAAQQAAQQAQAAAQSAQAAAQQQQQTLSATSDSVSSLKTSVDDLKANSVSLASTIQSEQTAVRKAIENPEAVHYKGITISPAGSFVAAESVWRQGATGGGLNTAFTGVPLDHSPAGNLSEFNASGRQSRIAIKATGKDGPLSLTGYYEMDWLSAGTTSNNNQSNSYTLRQRQIWGQAALQSGWKFTGGQMWSLTTETTKLLDNGTEILPSSIDPQYMAGFVWNRQYGFRMSMDAGKKFAIGMSAENDQMLVGGSSLPTNELIGASGTGGGLYNNQATYSFNLAPELVAKMAFEPGWGHWELFGVGRFFHDRIYPTGGSPYNDSVVGGGVGAGFRAPLGTKKGHHRSERSIRRRHRPHGFFDDRRRDPSAGWLHRSSAHLLRHLHAGDEPRQAPDAVLQLWRGLCQPSLLRHQRRRLWFTLRHHDWMQYGVDSERTERQQRAHSSVQLRWQQQGRAGVQRWRMVQHLQRP